MIEWYAQERAFVRPCRLYAVPLSTVVKSAAPHEFAEMVVPGRHVQVAKQNHGERRVNKVRNWLRSGNCNDAGNVVDLCRLLLARLPAQVRISLVCADSGFVDGKLFELLDSKGIAYIVASQLYANIKRLCRHDDAAWQPTPLAGIEIQEVEWNRPGQRLIVIRQRIAQRPDAGGKLLFDVPG